MNGFEVQDFDKNEARDEMCQTLIQDSEARFQYKHIADEHPSGNKLLTKYWYRHSTGNTHTTTSSDSTAISKTADLDEKGFSQKALGDIGLTGTVAVKVENPAFHVMKDRVEVLKSGLTALEKQNALGLALAATLKQKAQKMRASGPNDVKKAANDTQARIIIFHVHCHLPP